MIRMRPVLRGSLVTATHCVATSPFSLLQLFLDLLSDCARIRPVPLPLFHVGHVQYSVSVRVRRGRLVREGPQVTGVAN